MKKTIYDPAYANIVTRLQTRRKELGLRQEDVALALGVSRSWVGKVEQCERRLDVIELYRLCDLYGMRWADLELLISKGGSDEKK